MGTNEVSFFVPGIPKPGGSKKSFFNKKTGRAIIVDDCAAGKDWKTAVRFAGMQAMEGKKLMAGPIEISVCFHMPRIKGHFKPNGKLRASAPEYHTVKPDLTKLMRSTEDALTGVVWRDDSAIVIHKLVKRYGDKAGAEIEVREFMPAGEG